MMRRSDLASDRPSPHLTLPDHKRAMIGGKIALGEDAVRAVREPLAIEVRYIGLDALRGRLCARRAQVHVGEPERWRSVSYRHFAVSPFIRQADMEYR